MAREFTAEELRHVLAEVAEGDTLWMASTLEVINDRWLARGDGVAVYRNEAFDSSRFGHRQVASFGSAAAQLETEFPPTTLPDIGNAINWAYQLEGTYRGETL